MAWPVNTSSAWALRSPVWRHCPRNDGRALPAIVLITNSDAGIVTSAAAVITGEIENIMIATPSIIRTLVTIWEIVCWRLWARLSMSLVTRLNRSPRDQRSTVDSGS